MVSDFVFEIRRLFSMLVEISISDLHFLDDDRIASIVSALREVEPIFEFVIDIMTGEECVK